MYHSTSCCPQDVLVKYCACRRHLPVVPARKSKPAEAKELQFDISLSVCESEDFKFGPGKA